jgi:hypothetical protein
MKVPAMLKRPVGSAAEAALTNPAAQLIALFVEPSPPAVALQSSKFPPRNEFIPLSSKLLYSASVFSGG